MRRRGFTLIELLVVISIIVLLTGLLFPILGIARRRAANTNTEALLSKVDGALERFKGEMDTYPYQEHDVYATFTGAGNNLVYRLATDLSVNDLDEVYKDIEKVRDAYNGASSGAHAFDLNSYIPVDEQNPDYFPTYAEYVNRLAVERATMAVLAGNTTVKGVNGKSGVYDKTSDQVIASPSSNGYAFDYLSQDIGDGEVDGDDIIDFWGEPVVYNCPVVQGVVEFWPSGSGVKKGEAGFMEGSEHGIYPDLYEMQTIGRIATTSLGDDQRTHASDAYKNGFELWSSGEDRLIDGVFNNAVNKDNLSSRDFWKGLE